MLLIWRENYCSGEEISNLYSNMVVHWFILAVIVIPNTGLRLLASTGLNSVVTGVVWPVDISARVGTFREIAFWGLFYNMNVAHTFLVKSFIHFFLLLLCCICCITPIYIGSILTGRPSRSLIFFISHSPNKGTVV
ncbi:hypothetical protein BGX38DRAFT_488826 [Terfezia claveryi]|nr:hypothetical protein BGX38DRAFT_488826 [Terfezia claveryi]